jgi:hypothetical protein
MRLLNVILAIALWTALVAVPTAKAHADDERIVAAEAAAKADAATAAGGKYDETVGQAFGKDHGPTIGRCAKAAKRPDLSDFDLFLRVDATGVVEEVLVKPATNISGCVQTKLAGWKVPPPARAGTWVKVSVKLKRK